MTCLMMLRVGNLTFSFSPSNLERRKEMTRSGNPSAVNKVTEITLASLLSSQKNFVVGYEDVNTAL